MSRTEPTDHFLVSGYRKLIFMMLRETAQDLTRKPGVGNNDQLIADAREWVLAERSSVPGIPQPGLTFEDCITALGATADVDAYRKGFLERPEEAYKESLRALDALSASEGVFLEMKRSREVTLPVGSFTTDWLFSSQAEG